MQQQGSAILGKHLSSSSDDCLFLANDESLSEHTSPFKGTVITNRFDIYQQWQQTNEHVYFNDWSVDSLNDHFNKVIFHISKEKLVNMHLLHLACRSLKEDGEIIIIGHKNQGMPGFKKKIEEALPGCMQVVRHKKQWSEYQIKPPSFSLDSHHQDTYNCYHDIDASGITLVSKPGVFGWKKIDPGSEMLIDCLKRLDKLDFTNTTLLDLGCGYGYLSVAARAMGFIHIDATDNNAAAIDCCQKNFLSHSITGEVFAADCGNTCHKKYDLILCNPPFHKGFSHQKVLTWKFIDQASRLLNEKGKALFVVNAFIGLEKLASKVFNQITCLHNEGGFKVYLIEK